MDGVHYIVRAAEEGFDFKSKSFFSKISLYLSVLFYQTFRENDLNSFAKRKLLNPFKWVEFLVAIGLQLVTGVLVSILALPTFVLRLIFLPFFLLSAKSNLFFLGLQLVLKWVLPTFIFNLISSTLTSLWSDKAKGNLGSTFSDNVNQHGFWFGFIAGLQFLCLLPIKLVHFLVFTAMNLLTFVLNCILCPMDTWVKPLVSLFHKNPPASFLTIFLASLPLAIVLLIIGLSSAGVVLPAALGFMIAPFSALFSTILGVMTSVLAGALSSILSIFSLTLTAGAVLGITIFSKAALIFALSSITIGVVRGMVSWEGFYSLWARFVDAITFDKIAGPEKGEESMREKLDAMTFTAGVEEKDGATPKEKDVLVWCSKLSESTENGPLSRLLFNEVEDIHEDSSIELSHSYF